MEQERKTRHKCMHSECTENSASIDAASESSASGYEWRTISPCRGTEPEVQSDGHFMSGDDSGMQWFVDLGTANSMWIVTVTDGIRSRTRRLECTHEPMCGIDIADAERINGVIGEMKNELDSLLPWWKRVSAKFSHKGTTTQ